MRLRTKELGRRLVVVSPHLDDAVFSLGATIARAAREGIEAQVLTVFAGNPAAKTAPSASERACGFTSVGEAARQRRREDLEAVELLGGTPLWLPFADHDDPDAESDQIALAVAEQVRGAESLLLPGFPLVHRSHVAVTSVLLRAGLRRMRVGLYIEQPYASWYAFSRSGCGLRSIRALRPGPVPAIEGMVPTRLEWFRSTGSARDWSLKRRAALRYRSQLPQLRRLPLWRVGFYELLRGGEGIAWIDL